MNRKHLFIVASIIWGIPGVIITVKGISAYVMQPSENLWWLLLITFSVLAAFFMMFRRIVDRYCSRIASLPVKVKISQTFPPRGWILLVFMMGLGIALKHIPQIPSAFTAGQIESRNAESISVLKPESDVCHESQHHAYGFCLAFS